MQVYAVINADYDDNTVHEVFDNEEAANEYCEYWNNKKTNRFDGPRYPQVVIYDVLSEFEKPS